MLDRPIVSDDSIDAPRGAEKNPETKRFVRGFFIGPQSTDVSVHSSGVETVVWLRAAGRAVTVLNESDSPSVGRLAVPALFFLRSRRRCLPPKSRAPAASSW